MTHRQDELPPVLPTDDDPLVRALSNGVGGPAGRRVAAGHSWWTPVRVALAVVFVVSALGVLAKQPCRDAGWPTPEQFVKACYSDIPILYFSRGLADGAVPYFTPVPVEQQVEYPVLTGAVMWATTLLVPDGDTVERMRWYFDVNVLLLAVCAAVTVVVTARTAGRRPWDAVLVAAAPGLLLAGTINWDLWAVMLTSLALWAWARERPAEAGIWLGLATATKFYPLLLLGPLLLVCLRAGRLGPFAVTTAAAVAAWLAVNLPVMALSFDGWARFYELSQERGAGFSSIWYVLQQQGLGLSAGALNRVAPLLFLACCVGIAVLALRAPRRPRLAALAFLTVAAFLLTNKVYSPQYVVWLLPLAVLARPRWRDVLVWQACEVVHFFGIWSLLSGFEPGRADRALSVDGYGTTVLVHVVGTLWLAALVVRDALAPEHDPVRWDGVDDPAGGPVDGAPDAFRLAGRRPVEAAR